MALCRLMPPDPEEIRARFEDQEKYDKFLAGEDFSYGLADVTDAEFGAHYETIVSAMKNLGFDGLMLELPMVPHGFLRDADLVEGEWLDRYVVELAEWGARLAQQGLVAEESDDPHPLAWFQITNPEEDREAGRDLTKKLWEHTRKHVDRFPGRSRELDGRQYLNREDYLGWRGRWVKGNIASGLSTGLVISGWNRWHDERLADFAACRPWRSGSSPGGGKERHAVSFLWKNGTKRAGGTQGSYCARHTARGNTPTFQATGFKASIRKANWW